MGDIATTSARPRPAASTLRTYDRLKTFDVDMNRSALLAGASFGGGVSAEMAYDRYEAVKRAEPDIDKDRAAVLAAGVLSTGSTPRDLASMYRSFKTRGVDKERAALLAHATDATQLNVGKMDSIYESVKRAEPEIDKDRAAILAAGTAFGRAPVADTVRAYRLLKNEGLDKDRAALLASASAASASGGFGGSTSGADALRAYTSVLRHEPDIDKNRAALLASTALTERQDVRDIVGQYNAIKRAEPTIDKDRAAVLAALSSVDRPGRSTVMLTSAAWQLQRDIAECQPAPGSDWGPGGDCED